MRCREETEQVRQASGRRPEGRQDIAQDTTVPAVPMLPEQGAEQGQEDGAPWESDRVSGQAPAGGTGGCTTPRACRAG